MTCFHVDSSAQTEICKLHVPARAKCQVRCKIFTNSVRCQMKACDLTFGLRWLFYAELNAQRLICQLAHAGTCKNAEYDARLLKLALGVNQKLVTLNLAYGDCFLGWIKCTNWNWHTGTCRRVRKCRVRAILFHRRLRFFKFWKSGPRKSNFGLKMRGWVENAPFWLIWKWVNKGRTFIKIFFYPSSPAAAQVSGGPSRRLWI